MIEATINQGVITLSEVTRRDEFLPAHTAEATLKSRIRLDRVGIGLGIAGAAISMVGSGISFSQAISTELSPYHLYYQRYTDIAALAGLTFTGIGLVNLGLAGSSIASISENKLKLAKTQHLLSTTPARR